MRLGSLFKIEFHVETNILRRALVLYHLPASDLIWLCDRYSKWDIFSPNIAYRYVHFVKEGLFYEKTILQFFLGSYSL